MIRNNMQLIKHAFYLLLISSSLLIACNSNKEDKIIFVENDKIKIGFEKETGELLIFKDLIHSENLLDENISPGLPWEIESRNSTDPGKNSGDAPSKFEYSKPNPFTLYLKWSDFSAVENKDVRISVEIALEENNSFSTWNISLDGISGKQINKVAFPIIRGLKDLENEYLAVPTWFGSLMKNPRTHLERGERKEWSYPGLSMQFLTLYNPNKIGFYAAAKDSLSYYKRFALSLDSSKNITYEMINFPAIDTEQDQYSPSYDAVIGTFGGDWITAAERYREWGSQQPWSKKSRLKNELVPSWLEDTAIWVWNRGESDNVLPPALDLQERLGLRVSVFWHWWHNDSYDDTFPEYFPPREGGDSFISAVTSAKEQGVNPIIYMNQLQWGTQTDSFQELNVPRHTVKDSNGEMITHVYNIFSGKSLTNVCITSQFWKDYYTSLVDTAVNKYKTSGVYMDQAGLSRMCYDPNHGHDIGGGNYWANNSAGLTNMIRSKISSDDLTLAGEGALESFIPYLDAFLTLGVGRERYRGIDAWKPIPLFQAVYHQYAIAYGNYSSLLIPPYDEKWPEEFAPENPHKLLDADYNKQFHMEQARSFVWGMQPTISNYQSFLANERKEEIDFLKKLLRVRYNGLKYLLYGKFLRTPDMKIEIPEEELKISRLSIYAGRREGAVTTFEESFPSIYSGTWKADDGNIGIALASISDESFQVDYNFKSHDYDLPLSGEIFIIDADGKRFLTSYTDGNIDFGFTLAPKDVYIVELKASPYLCR